ncbi:BadF/BadG/BcrA/BcrD ATPase family protein [Bacillus sp. FSL K6-3431]|uniref:BadF/BadG/BcrA/BcrD ATPase family protein n=1 Tax=Bacillus sp. FSL K6-3431 TaxID=2921500 RepID=UPI0030F818D6
MNYTIGIDAGGTKTTGLIIDDQKNIVFQIETGFGNPNVHFDDALANVWGAVSACLSSEFGISCKRIVAGIAGIEAAGNRERFSEFFKGNTDLPVTFVNDAVLAYHALLGEANGILTIAGTGSISYGVNGENEGYSGGWGHLLGDSGSSYDIAIKVCQQITEEFDRGLPYSKLSQAILQEIGIKEAPELKGFIYNASKGEIASLSYQVFIEAEKGNEFAKQYFYHAGRDLAKQTAWLYKKLQLDSPLKIACKGSLLEKNSYVQSQFKSTLRKSAGKLDLIMNDLSPAIGAATIASMERVNYQKRLK